MQNYQKLWRQKIWPRLPLSRRWKAERELAWLDGEFTPQINAARAAGDPGEYTRLVSEHSFE